MPSLASSLANRCDLTPPHPTPHPSPHPHPSPQALTLALALTLPLTRPYPGAQLQVHHGRRRLRDEPRRGRAQQEALLRGLGLLHQARAQPPGAPTLARLLLAPALTRTPALSLAAALTLTPALSLAAALTRTPALTLAAALTRAAALYLAAALTLALACTHDSHQGTFVFYSNVPSTPVAIYLCQSDNGVLKVPRDAPVRLSSTLAIAVLPMLSMGLNVLSMNARMFTSIGEKEGAAISLDGGGDGKADLMRSLSSRGSLSADGGMLSEGASLDAVRGASPDAMQRVDQAMTV